MSKFEGKCPSCGKTHHSNRKNDIIVCHCFRLCPLCGAEMEPYNPDLAPTTYAADGKRDLAVLMVCARHFPPFFSTRKPVEVVCT